MISVNTVYENIADGNKYRILWFSSESNIAYTINLTKDELPKQTKVSDITDNVSNGDFTLTVYCLV